MKGNVNYLELANSPLMWVSAAIAVGIVVFQSVLFFRKSLKAAKEIGIEQEKINMAIKSSAISSIGPSIVILVTMISLIVSMGAPVSWMRLSFIGSVNYEAMAAGFGAQAMGATLENLTPVAFACGVWTMICGSLGWLIFTLLFTDKMDKVNHLMSKGNSKMVPIISAGAMLGAFANLASGNFFNEKNQFCIWRSTGNRNNRRMHSYDDPDKVSERKEYWMAQRMGLCNFHVLRHAHWLHLEHCILIGMRG